MADKVMTTLTDDERKLLHQCYSHLGYVVANPKAGINSLRTSRASGGGHGFDYEVTKASLDGTWRHYEVEAFANGLSSFLRFDEPHLRVSISFTRLAQWASSLPAELRERATVAWATHPVDTRDLAELARIVHEAIDLGATRLPSVTLEYNEPTDLLQLLAMETAP